MEMEYGLRRYETFHRLLWFGLFLLCLFLALPAAKLHMLRVPYAGAELMMRQGDYDTLDFWTRQPWIHAGVTGRLVLYLGWVALLYLGFRLGGVIVQFFGKRSLNGSLERLSDWLEDEEEADDEGRPNALHGDRSATEYLREQLLPTVQRTPQRLLFHCYQRVAWVLSGPRGVDYSNDLLAREQRLVDADWQIHQSSWEPFLWALRLLPFLALAQTFLMFYTNMDLLMEGQGEVQEAVGLVLTSLVPFAQALALTLALQLGYGLIRRLDNLYLADVDAMIYDHLLSRLPIQSNDTAGMIRELRIEFLKLQEGLQRIESLLRNSH